MYGYIISYAITDNKGFYKINLKKMQEMFFYL